MAKTDSSLNERMRLIPKVDDVQAEAGYGQLVKTYSAREAEHYLNVVLQALRTSIREGKDALQADGAVAKVLEKLQAKLQWHRHRRKQKIINATGVILHTGLGRAYMGDAVRERLAECAGYSNVEVDIHSGQRNFREEYLADLLCILTGAEAATVVNNNAAATMLIINTFAMGKEVIVSRGEMVEIGGSFRVPEVMERAMAKLVEVGSTNKTHLKDYEKAITPNTGLLLKVHTSNYVIEGFTQAVELDELVALGEEHGVAVAEDLGSGALFDPLEFGMRGEPLVADSLKSGMHAICFSGDKLVGGPQAGIVLGSRKAVSAIRANPLYRALRVGKLTLAALEATVESYLNADRTALAAPAGSMMSIDMKELEARGKHILQSLADLPDLEIELLETTVQPGSGSLPGQKIASMGLAVRSKKASVDQFAAALRQGETPVFSRIEDGRVWLDLRTVQADEDDDFLATIRNAASGLANS